MILLAALLLAPLLLDQTPPVEDAEHRADRLRAEQLNRDAGRNARAPASSGRDSDDWREAQDEYRQAQAEYARDLARWRRQVAECRGGDWDACRPR